MEKEIKVVAPQSEEYPIIIDNLTKDQVKSIYVGETTSWSEVE